ncbi:MAG: hypothetical protein AAF560_29870 [Acidobacteriota bacterium]
MRRRPGKLSRKRLRQLLAVLRYYGLRPEDGFPQWMTEGQLEWPEDSPLSEAELRAEIGTQIAGIKSLRERAERLRRMLPAEPQQDLNSKPLSVYSELSHVATSCNQVAEDQLAMAEAAVAATADSLRRVWIRSMLQFKARRDPWCLLGTVTDEEIDELMDWLNDRTEKAQRSKRGAIPAGDAGGGAARPQGSTG